MPAARASRPRCTAAWVLLLALVTAIACSTSDEALSGRISAAIAMGDGAVVDFRELADFAWDRLHTFPPYTRAGDVEADLGFRWDGAKRSDIEHRDDITLLVFVPEGRVVRTLEDPREQVAFSELRRPGGWRPATASFVVRLRSDTGWLVLVEPDERSDRDDPRTTGHPPGRWSKTAPGRANPPPSAVGDRMDPNPPFFDLFGPVGAMRRLETDPGSWS